MGEVLQPYQPIVNMTLAYAPELRFDSADELIRDIDYYFGSATGMRRMPYLLERRRQHSGGGQDLIHNIDFYFGTVPGMHWVPYIVERRERDCGSAIRLQHRRPRRSDGYEGIRRSAWP